MSSRVHVASFSSVYTLTISSNVYAEYTAFSSSMKLSDSSIINIRSISTKMNLIDCIEYTLHFTPISLLDKTRSRDFISNYNIIYVYIYI